jgi:hypothetical protein
VVGSPAVDAVSAATCPPPESDQRGVARPQNTTCDIGAFELVPAQPGTVQFGAASFSVGEGGGNAIITITRTDSSTGAISVGYTTATGGTATEGADYTYTSGFLDWADGDTASKTLMSLSSMIRTWRGNETLNLTLRNPDGRATLGAPNTAVLTITDNDAGVTCAGLTATIVGTAAGEAIPGTAGPDVINGLGGVDQITGLDGNDILCGVPATTPFLVVLTTTGLLVRMVTISCAAAAVRIKSMVLPVLTSSMAMQQTMR